jgi:hypothetical protein
MVELSNAARGPLETTVSMSQVTHDKKIKKKETMSA